MSFGAKLRNSLFLPKNIYFWAKKTPREKEVKTLGELLKGGFEGML
jgi:hypothetical protein